MDWLRSEDLKEEKVLTTSILTITRRKRISSFQVGPVSGFGCHQIQSQPSGIAASYQGIPIVYLICAVPDCDHDALARDTNSADLPSFGAKIAIYEACRNSEERPRI